jgi:hypothetical protein
MSFFQSSPTIRARSGGTVDGGQDFAVVGRLRLGGVHVLVGRHQGVGVLIDRHAGPGQPLFDGRGWEERVGGDDDGQPASEGGADEMGRRRAHLC